MSECSRRNWRELAALAAREGDPEELLALVTELNAVLLQQQEQRDQPRVNPSTQLLFVDDESAIRITMAPILQERGFDVAVAATVSEALEIVANRKLDVLLCDLNIEQEHDGFTVVREMRKKNPRSVIFILTGCREFQTAVEAIRQQVDDYIEKPADIDALVIALEQKLLLKHSQVRTG